MTCRTKSNVNFTLIKKKNTLTKMNRKEQKRRWDANNKSHRNERNKHRVLENNENRDRINELENRVQELETENYKLKNPTESDSFTLAESDNSSIVSFKPCENSNPNRSRFKENDIDNLVRRLEISENHNVLLEREIYYLKEKEN